MTDKEKIREYLIGMADAACCNKQTAKDIKEIIIPHIDSMQEEPVSEDLDAEIEMIRKYHFINDDFDKAELDGRTISNIARHFANWQKEHMMKDSIDTTIKQGCIDLGVFIKGLDKDKFNFGDKVKVIVIKED